MRFIPFAAVAAALLLGAAARSQIAQPQPSTLPRYPSVTGNDPHEDDGLRQMQERMARNAMSDRQKRMIADADRLQQLATELKADVDKTTKDEMSLATIKKAAEVEKLARDIKDKMRGQ